MTDDKNLIPQYEKHDYTNGIAPYEYLYQLRDKPLIHDAVQTTLSAAAQAEGFRGFRKRYSIYCQSINLNGAKAVNNLTCFEGQKLELMTGNWQTSEFEVWCDNGNMKMEACNHPILPVERLINIDTPKNYELHFEKAEGGAKSLQINQCLPARIRL